jgi:hypothetical protein
MLSVCHASTLLFETQTPADLATDSGHDIDLTNYYSGLFSGVGYLSAAGQPAYFGFGNEPFYSCNRCRHNISDLSPVRWTWSVPKLAGQTRLYISMLIATSIAINDGFELVDVVELKLGTAEILKEGLYPISDHFSHLAINGKLLAPTAQRLGKIVTVPGSAANLTLQLSVLTTSRQENLAFGSLKVYACDVHETGMWGMQQPLVVALMWPCDRPC